ncbi:hypothetical protein BGY98DRAFT_188062 [Russula aff. rugulosa BPL654]|nr:hypothetical protein BGY98DRAFT_188062 [Russula aff. rugulosa BPL654]
MFLKYVLNWKAGAATAFRCKRRTQRTCRSSKAKGPSSDALCNGVYVTPLHRASEYGGLEVNFGSRAPVYKIVNSEARAGERRLCQCVRAVNACLRNAMVRLWSTGVCFAVATRFWSPNTPHHYPYYPTISFLPGSSIHIARHLRGSLMETDHTRRRTWKTSSDITLHFHHDPPPPPRGTRGGDLCNITNYTPEGRR